MIDRRSVLKSLAGIPVLGLFGYAALRNWKYENRERQQILSKLGLDEITSPETQVYRGKADGEPLRIGMIGFGNRAAALARGLGYMHPDEVEKRRQQGTLEQWLEQEDLNVTITGICDVFDLHASNGLAVASNEPRPGGAHVQEAKRYRHYKEMLKDKEIDAVMIATPDHHHARMAIDAIRAGKHVYCEKSVALREDELNELYREVRNSDRIFQLGHQITQNRVFRKAREIVKKGILGKITMVETNSNRNTAHGAWVRHLDAQGNPKPGDAQSIDWQQWLGDASYHPFSIERFYNWTLWFDYSMGLISQLFTHEFDAVNQLLQLGIPASVNSSGGIFYWKDGREMADVLDVVLAYTDRELTLKYSGNLASSRQRGRVLMGHDASMDMGGTLRVTVDANSTRFKKEINAGILDPSEPFLTIDPAGNVDAFTSATEQYYASRGLISTTVNGRVVDVTHLHIREWIDCIRNGGVPTANIKCAYEEGIACLMAHRSYVEKRQIDWDPVKNKIV